MKQNNVLIIIIVAIVVGGLAFFGGMQYQKSKAPTRLTGANGFQRGQFGQNGGRGGNRSFGGATVGTIASMDNNSLTIKLQDGSSKIVDLSGSTTYSKTDSGSKTDLSVGTRVAAWGGSHSSMPKRIATIL
jgi:hypothetical protein